MGWRYEIYRTFFVSLGTIELLTNLKYLVQKDGISQARKQHKEIPVNVTYQQMKRKVICMLIFGGLFFSAGISSFLIHSINYTFSVIVLSAFFIYAISEALYYRYRNTVGFSFVAFIFLLLFVI